MVGLGASALTLSAGMAACTGTNATGEPEDQPDAGEPEVFDDCSDNDPLTRADWVGFCEDRVDDDCTINVNDDPCNDGVNAHNLCQTADEPCPTTQPGSAPPNWDCTGTPPENVIAFALFEQSNNQVLRFCTFVYESTEFAGEHYIAVDVDDGNEPNGPNGLCAADYSARRHIFYSDLEDDAGNDTGCDGVKYIHAYPQENPTGESYPVDDQKLSNTCRKAIRNIVRNPQANFEPDIQYFAASRSEALGKLAILDTAEVACVGIDNLDNEPYRPGEIWVVQAAQEIEMTGN